MAFVISSFTLKTMNEVSRWSRCWRKISIVDGSCIPWAEVALWTVNGSSTPPHQVKVKINFEKQLTALHVVRTFHLFNRYVFILLTKMRTKTKTIPFMTGKVFWGFVWDNGRYLQCTRFPSCHDLIYFQRSGVCTLWFSHMCLILFLAYTRNRRIFIGKNYLFTFLMVLSGAFLPPDTRKAVGKLG